MQENPVYVPRGPWDLAVDGIAGKLGVPVADVEALLVLAASSARVKVWEDDDSGVTYTEVGSSAFRLDEGELAGRWAICECLRACYAPEQLDEPYQPPDDGSVILRPSGRSGPALDLSFEPYALPSEREPGEAIVWSAVCFADERYDTRAGESDHFWALRVKGVVYLNCS